MGHEDGFQAAESPLAAAQSSAAVAVGRLDGGLEHATPATLRILATRLLRDSLIASLRQEGHAFTEQRFHAWFAGLATLSDTQARQAHPPRTLCEAILTELTHSGWPPLAEIALRMMPAFLAPRDLAGEDRHAQVHALMGDARRLVEECQPPSVEAPLAGIGTLYASILGSVRFAPAEHQYSPTLYQQPAARCRNPPFWAIELHCGQGLKKAGWLHPALPLVGLVRQDALGETDPALAAIKRAEALRGVADRLYRTFGEASRLSTIARDQLPPPPVYITRAGSV